MNKKSGKFIVFMGFFVSLISSIAGIFAGGVSSILSTISAFLLFAGFLMIFLADRKIVSFIIALGFGVSFIAPLIWGISVSGGMVTSQTTVSLSGALQVIKATTALMSVISLVSTVAYILWAIRLFRTTPIGALAVIVSIILPLVIFILYPSSYTSVGILSLLISVISPLLRTFAAGRDYKSRRN